jgi:hypothetical protein
MFVTKKHLDRRTVLKGAGAVMGLPLLEAMIPAASAQTSRQLKTCFIYTPHGVILDEWLPSETGNNFSLSPILRPLEPYKDYVQVISGLAGRPNSVGSGHATASCTWLSSALAKDTSGADVEAGKTIDQYIADTKTDTVIPSIQLGIEDVSHMVGACDGTSSCGYINSISWKDDKSPLPMEINPRIIFERMFGYGATTEERLARTQTDISLLDSLRSSTANLNAKLGVGDRVRLNNFLESVREVEQRIGRLESKMIEQGSNLQSAPIEIPELYEDHVNLQLEMIRLAFQTDTSHVASLMLSRELNQRTYPQIGVPEQHHGISHHGYNEERMAQHAIINTYHVVLMSNLVGMLNEMQDVDGSMLDNTLIMYGSGMGDGNVHSHNPRSNLIIGGGAGKLGQSQHLMHEEAIPSANLLLSVLDVAGINLDSIGNSTGRIAI